MYAKNSGFESCKFATPNFHVLSNIKQSSLKKHNVDNLQREKGRIWWFFEVEWALKILQSSKIYLLSDEQRKETSTGSSNSNCLDSMRCATDFERMLIANIFPPIPEVNIMRANYRIWMKRKVKFAAIRIGLNSPAINQRLQYLEIVSDFINLVRRE